ncbi:hypothetical protein A6723_006645 [Pseudomonas sp. AU11447]|uniref:hypothetical protein n=1 Tax=unclassified Pseudomonas TaxID=196821 RepID=UPI0006D45FCF|nr:MULTISPECIES: hypothetical protein [unclassified Pseudomonas]OBY87573.1 hypothetical protein A6723_006645 [Pseudomonas sp. AU11447]
MVKTYAVCRIDGLIELHDEHPGDGYFALAVGDSAELRRVIDLSADPVAGLAWRVPGVRAGAEPRTNLGAIARYIRDLSTHDAPGVRALGV